jgi:hypothetical protein
MKKLLLILIALFLWAGSSWAQMTVSVGNNTNTTPTLAVSYPSLSLALTDLNAVTAMTGPISLTCSGSETAPSTGFVLGSATLNPVLNAAGSNMIFIFGPATINAGVGTNATSNVVAPDGMFKLVGADRVVIDGLTFTDGNSASATVAMEFGLAMFKYSATDGCNYNTVQNCTFNMQRISFATSAAPLVEGAVGIGIYNSLNGSCNAVATPTTTAGANSYNQIYTNTINGGNYGMAVIGYAGSTPFTLCDTGNDIGGASAGTGNQILNYGGGTSTTNPAAGIRTLAQYGLNISYNTVNNNNGSGVNHPSTLRGIYTNTAVSASETISYNTLTITSGAATSQVSVIENVAGGTAASNTVNINNNTFSVTYTTATTATVYGVYSTSTSTPATLNMNYNNCTSINYSGAALAGSGIIYPIYSAGAATTASVSNNTVNNITRTGTNGAATYGVYVTAATTQTVNNNTVSNITLAGTGTAGDIYGVRSTGTTVTSNSNTIYNLSNSKTTGTGLIYGMYNFGSPTNETYNNNIIHDISHSGTAAGVVYGMYFNTATGVRTVSGNQIYAISSGGVTVAGILNTTSSPTTYKNKIYNIQSTNAAPLVSGIIISSVGTAGYSTTYNNLIGDLKAPNASTNDAIRGINISSVTASSTNNVYYNSVYLNASSVGANFGTTGIYHAASATATTAVLNLRNNVIVNNSTAAGTGKVTCFRRSLAATLGNYASTSNNNDFYSATGSVMYDGTTEFNITAFKAAVTPRDASSFSENPTFISTLGSSTDFLHINTITPTQIESGGTAIATYTTDYDGETRNVSTPDIGADEFVGVGIDLTAPAISYTVIANQLPATPIILNATISDATGVPTSGLGLPVLYYKINSGSYTAVTASHISGSNYSFSFTPATVATDVVSYYVVAQDIATAVNIGAYPSGGASGFTANPPACSTPPTSPSTFTVVAPMAGTFTVGTTTGTYATLKAAFDDINARVVTGNIILDVQAEGTTETATAVLNLPSYNGGTWTVTVKPNSTATITGAIASAPLIKLFGASNVIIDGSNSGGTDKSLTISNTSITTPSVITVGSNGTTPITNVTLKNCNFINGINTSSAVYVCDATTTAAAGYFSNVTIQNNTVQKAYIGIYSIAVLASGNGSGLLINGNDLTTSGTNAITYTGIYVQGVDGATVSNNLIANFDKTGSQDDRGIWFATGTVNSSIFNNKIYTLGYSGTSGYGAYGLAISTGTLNANISAYNNIIYDIMGDGYTYITYLGDNPIGIYAFSAQSGIKLYYNSINLYGSTLNAADAMSIGIALGTATIADIRNNSIVNNLGLSSATGYGSVAIYAQTSNAQFSTIDNNDYYVNPSGAGVKAIGKLSTTTTALDLAAWKIASAQDAHSISSDPLYTSTTDLLPLSGTPLMAAATPIAGVTTDYNGTARSVTTPTIGAYELAITAAIDWANLQWPGSGSIPEGGSYDVYAQAWEDGVTPGAGQGAGIQCWIGWNTTDTNPNTWTNWTAATYNGDSGNNDEYKATIGGSLAAGTYYYASRFIITDGAYQYGGFSGGFWDGSTNVSGVLNVTNSDIGWANLQSPGSTSITQGGSATIYGQVWVDGVTSNSGSSAAISAWIGYGTSASDFSGYTWTTATFSSQVGNNDEYTASIGAALAPGTYYYVTRFKFLTDADVYGGYSAGGGGFWDGTTYLAGTLTVNPYTITIPYSQGFESVTFPPTAWTAQSVLGTEVWARSTAGFRTGVASAAITYQTTGGEDWLITPQVMSIVSGDQLAFYWKNKFGSPYPPDQLDVLVSTTDATLSSFTTTLGTINTGISTPSWVAVNYSLDAFAGQNIYIAFKHTDTDGNGIYLDDVTLANVNTLWTGTSSTDWAVAGNWSNGVPTSGMNVTIADVTNNPLIATAVTVNNLTINSGGVLSISPAGQLTVTTALTNNGGTAGLILKSDGSGTGSLMHISDNVNATIERYVTGSSVLTNNHYHNVAIPMNADMTAAVFTGMYAFSFDAAAQDWSIVGPSTSDPVYKDRGYLIYSPLSSTTISFAGQMNNGNFVASTPSGASSFVDPNYVGGYNLVPNPYPSAIDWDVASGFTESNLRTSIWLFNASSGNYGAYVRGASGGTGTNGATRTIPVGQAFFVQATDAGAPALTITNVARKHGNANILKQTESMKDMLRMKSYNDSYSDELIVKFDGAASNAFDDAMDAQKLRGSAEASQIYSLTPQGTELSINNVPYSTQTVTIPVAFELGNSSEATFGFTGLESFESSVSIFLEDKLLNKTIDLRLNPVYNFTHTADADPMRFNLVFYGVNSTGELSTANYNIWVNNDKINVLIPEMIGQKAVVQLIDQQGRILDATSVTLDSPSVINAPVSSGLYIVRVIVGNQAFTSKVFIR